LRDLVDHLREKWAGKNLEHFLAQQWRRPAHDARSKYEALVLSRAGKAPTVKQSVNTEFVNLWFGGHVEPFYELIGHPRTFDQSYDPVATRGR
jgi:hypothetical protein